MACGFDPTDSLVAWGGMDNTCTIVPARTPSEVARRKELHGHDGYVSGVKFVTKDSILTSSGDSTCILWDTNKCTSIRKFTDHAADVLALCPSPTDENVFCSCSIDSTAKVWDIRTGKCVQTFVGHDGDVNCVDFLPNGQSFATGGDDAAVFLFDLRSCARINEMLKEDTIVTQVSSVGFSKSGRVLFAGHDDCNVYGWDSLLESASNPIYTMGGHTYRVSCLGMNPSGEALCTGSWDTDLVVRMPLFVHKYMDIYGFFMFIRVFCVQIWA
jgi:guanine nucleotide-binding protein G(I)/G(S)/G(T) subunit beta-1